MPYECMLCDVGIKRTNGKKSLDNTHIPDDPDGYGWKKVNTQLEINWIAERPAPDKILEFTTCSCEKTRCLTNQCQCRSLQLQCMDLCQCRNCNNIKEVLDDEDDDTENDDDEDEDNSSESDESDSDDIFE